MELVNDLFVYAFTAVLLSFLVSKLISLLVSSGEVGGGGKESCAGGVGEGNLEKRLKVEGLKSLKKKAKKISAETFLVSEFKGETEQAFGLGGLVKADDSLDDRKELASGEKHLQFLGTEASETCSADQLLSAGEVGGLESSVITKKDDFFGVDGPVENEGLICSSEITLNERAVEEQCREIGCPIEGFEQEINSGNDLGKLVVCDQGTDYKEDDVVGEELERYDFNHKQEVGSVGHGDQELVNDGLSSERREEVSEELYEQDEERERSEPKVDDTIDAGLLDGENVVDDQHEHHMILESLETELKVHTQEAYADKFDAQNEELSSSVSKEDVVNREEEGGTGDEETERSEPEIDDIMGVGFLGGENAVDDVIHKLHMILESLEIEPKDGTKDGYVNQVDDQNEEIRDEEVRIGDLGKGEMEISDGEEWEGIERTELEKEFAKALNFVECGNKHGQLSTLGSDVIMQFYGLQKVSMEGPCHEPPPMALKLSARAKWNAWQKLGSMIPEEAMEKYINLLTDKVPGWMGEHPSVEDKLSSEVDGACSSSDANLRTTLTLPLTCIDESKPGEEPVMRAGDFTGNSTSLNKDEDWLDYLVCTSTESIFVLPVLSMG